jgi:uncharacterized protein YhaN
MKLILLIIALSVTATAQTPAKPEQNAKLKPLVAEMTKAQEALNAKLIQLPEAKAVQDAKAAYDKAVAALNIAAEKLPEREMVKTAEARVLDFMYRVQAEHALSSREYKPIISANGELAFVKIGPPKE